MIINLNDLFVKDKIEIDYRVEKDDNLDKRIIDLKDSFVKGSIYYNSLDELILDCEFKGIMYIEDSISLDRIPYEFNINIEENIDSIKENYLDAYDFSKNTLDLKEVLWQNIVLEVPMNYSIIKDASIKGDGWELIDKDKSVKEIDPRLEKLTDLLKKGDD